jgi:hypothetical protein
MCLRWEEGVIWCCLLSLDILVMLFTHASAPAAAALATATAANQGVAVPARCITGVIFGRHAPVSAPASSPHCRGVSMPAASDWPSSLSILL